jgi:hypothetical protein
MVRSRRNLVLAAELGQVRVAAQPMPWWELFSP